MNRLDVGDATDADAAAVLGVIHAAFAARPALDPPSTALTEDVDSVGGAIASTGALLATVDGEPAGAVLLDETGDGTLLLRRVSVHPDHQGRGVATAVVGCAEDVARRRGLGRVELIARTELPANVEFWLRRGYTRVGGTEPELLLAKAVPLRLTVATRNDMHAFGRALAARLRAGDVLVLSGELGAGKTTLTQGIGDGLGVRGPVASPTFVIARQHPSLVDGPPLVHVDAYRLDDAAELDDLDLDTGVETAVTVVEWGAGLADGLSADRLEVTIRRIPDAVAESNDIDGNATGEDEPREVSITPVGARWAREPLVALGDGLPVAEGAR